MAKDTRLSRELLEDMLHDLRDAQEKLNNIRDALRPTREYDRIRRGVFGHVEPALFLEHEWVHRTDEQPLERFILDALEEAVFEQAAEVGRDLCGVNLDDDGNPERSLDETAHDLVEDYVLPLPTELEDVISVDDLVDSCREELAGLDVKWPKASVREAV